MPPPVQLRGLAWDHPRGIGAARAAGDAYNALHDEVHITWHNRPLWEFAYARLDDMFAEYDIVLFDHPTIGENFAGRCPMARLNDHFEDSWLCDLRRDSMGPSYESYLEGDSLWALPVDVAVQVAVIDPAVITDGLTPPRTWAEVTEFAADLRRLGREIGLPMNYSDAAVNLYTIGSQLVDHDFYEVGRGFDVAALEAALEQLQVLVNLSRADTFDKPPVEVVEDLAAGGSLAYIPLQFGYINYGWGGFRQRRLAFVDPPTFSGAAGGSALGGVGLGMSASTKYPREAADFCAFMAGGECQSGPYFLGGGQPSHRAAWSDPLCDEVANQFFTGTAASVESSVIRPRRADCPTYFEYQTAIGEELLAAVKSGTPLPSLSRRLRQLDPA